MSKDEMRFLRRELISAYLQAGWTNVNVIACLVRISEYIRYEQELQAYK